MARRALGEARLARQLCQAPLMRRLFPGMRQHDRNRGDAVFSRCLQCRDGLHFGQCLDLGFLDDGPPAKLGHLLVQHRGQE